MYYCNSKVWTLLSAVPAKITRSASFKASRLRCLIWRLLFLPRRPRAMPPRKHGMPNS